MINFLDSQMQIHETHPREFCHNFSAKRYRRNGHYDDHDIRNLLFKYYYPVDTSNRKYNVRQIRSLHFRRHVDRRITMVRNTWPKPLIKMWTYVYLLISLQNFQVSVILMQTGHIVLDVQISPINVNWKVPGQQCSDISSNEFHFGLINNKSYRSLFNLMVKYKIALDFGFL